MGEERKALVEVTIEDVTIRGYVGVVEIERGGKVVALPAKDRELWRRLRGMLESVGNEAFVEYSREKAKKP